MQSVQLNFFDLFTCKEHINHCCWISWPDAYFEKHQFSFYLNIPCIWNNFTLNLKQQNVRIKEIFIVLIYLSYLKLWIFSISMSVVHTRDYYINYCKTVIKHFDRVKICLVYHGLISQILKFKKGTFINNISIHLIQIQERGCAEEEDNLYDMIQKTF